MERLGLGHVAALALVYVEPLTDTKRAARRCRVSGLSMEFAARILPVEIDSAVVLGLADKTRAIASGNCPAPKDRCADCAAVDRLLDLLEASALSAQAR